MLTKATVLTYIATEHTITTRFSFLNTMADPLPTTLKDKLARAGSKVADLVKKFEYAASKPATKRTRYKAQSLSPGEDIFHNYRPPPSSVEESTPVRCGKKRYKWTQARTKHLTRLIVHSDIKFDDIPVVMRDESGDGPWYTITSSHHLRHTDFLTASQPAASVGMKSSAIHQIWHA